MKTPVIDFITEYENAQTTRMHMPGHKGQALLGFEGRDITEIKGAGELYESTGPVGEAEGYTAELFGSAKTCWSTEGSSQCIRAMLACALENWKSQTRCKATSGLQTNGVPTSSEQTCGAKTSSEQTSSEQTSGAKTSGEQTSSAKTSSAQTCSAQTSSAQTCSAQTCGAPTGDAPKTDSPATQFQAPRPYVLAARNVHRSFLTACALLDLDIEWLWPETNEFTLCSCQVTLKQVDLFLSNCVVTEAHNSAIKTSDCPGNTTLPIAVYLTSPDYLGGMQNIKSIADVCHKYNVPLLVDNAHGAYLKFLNRNLLNRAGLTELASRVPEETSLHPLDQGADLCCDSAHKTLPAVTGCAYLHISKTAPNSFAESAKKNMALFGSTSPSWLLLQSLDKCNELLATEYPVSLTRCVAQLGILKEKLFHAGWVLHGVEPLKLTVNATASGYTGPELADALRSHNIECEYADPDYVVLMPSPYNTDEDWSRLEKAFLGGSTTPTGNVPTTQNAPTALKPRPIQYTTNFTLNPPKRVLTPRQAMLAPSTTVPVEQAAGSILATGTLSCPPAVSVITAGELISEDAIPVLEHYGITEVEVVNQ